MNIDELRNFIDNGRLQKLINFLYEIQSSDIYQFVREENRYSSEADFFDQLEDKFKKTIPGEAESLIDRFKNMYDDSLHFTVSVVRSLDEIKDPKASNVYIMKHENEYVCYIYYKEKKMYVPMGELEFDPSIVIE